MRRRFFLRAAVTSLAAALLAKALVSCVDLDSLGNGPPDGAAPPEASAPETSDPCLHIAPPSAPELEGPDPNELPTFVLALDQVSLDPEKVSALDLDGTCTCDGRPGSALDGGPSCASPTITCDEDGGVDNAAGVVAATASPLVAIDGLSNRLIASGRRTLLLQIAKYNGGANDGEVVVGSILAEGIRSQGCPSSVFDGNLMVWSRGGCGDDPWTLSPSAVVATAGSGALPLIVGTGYVRDYQLVVRFGAAARLPTNDESAIRFGAPLLSGRLVPLDENLAPRDPTRAPTEKEKRLFRIERGVLAGRILATELLETLGTYRQSATGVPLCASNGFETVRNIVCASPDIASAPAADPSARCEALSAALGFEAIPALAASVADASVTSTSCASVDAALFTCP